MKDLWACSVAPGAVLAVLLGDHECMSWSYGVEVAASEMAFGGWEGTWPDSCGARDWSLRR